MNNKCIKIGRILQERFSDDSFTKMELSGIYNDKIADESLKYLENNPNASMIDVNVNFFYIEEKYG